jgi:uracil-DNA glycosylase family 4
MIEFLHDCTKCKLHRAAETVCEGGHGAAPATVMVVSKMPNSDRYQSMLEHDLRNAGLNLIHTKIYWASALKCRNFEANASNGDIKACREYLDREMAAVKPEFILTMGNEALLAVTGHSGIMKWRGRPLEAYGAKVLPTISPSAVLARPQNRPGYEADLKLFVSLVKGIPGGTIIPIDFTTIDMPSKLKELASDLEVASLICFDIETNIVPLHEYDVNARIISLSGTYVVQGQVRGFALPLYHPESPFRTRWRSVVKFITRYIADVAKRIAHNGKFDCRWLMKFSGVKIWNTFDTMLGTHLLNENVLKGLKPQAQMRLGVPPWGVDTANLLNMDLSEVLKYNFLDTYYDYLIYLQIIDELKQQPRLARIYKFLNQPANRDLIQTESRGMWVDVDRLTDRLPKKRLELQIVEEAIAEWLPPKDSDEWPTDSKGRPLERNFNPSNFCRWFLFDWLHLPVLARGKEKDDGSIGAPSLAADVLSVMMEDPDHHPVIDLMAKRAGLQKDLSFLESYSRLIDDQQRMRTVFKLGGTVTGRLASGKEDSSKFVGSASKIKGFNAQQVPRDPFIRGVIGSTPGWTWVEADYSQIELRIAAFCANERTMIRMYNEGADIHMETTIAVTKLPRHKITKELRKKIGKPVNFGFLYGMGWMKFIYTAFNNYGVRFTEQEAQAYRDAYFRLFSDLPAWHDRQRRLVRANGRVQSPIGRIRHLPDIESPEHGVRAEAERQAINSPVQGFASDMAVLSMVRINEKLRERNLDDAAHCLGLVHDATNWEVRDDKVKEVLPIIKDGMEDMQNIRRKFGLNMTLPIIADLKVGRHWGDSIELTPEQVYEYPGLEKIQEYNVAY